MLSESIMGPRIKLYFTLRNWCSERLSDLPKGSDWIGHETRKNTDADIHSDIELRQYAPKCNKTQMETELERDLKKHMKAK